MRGGPGLGNIDPEQADYFQAVKGGGHGSYRMIVLAPASVQEMADLTVLAFDLADQYRNPVMVPADGILGQMMEPVELAESYPNTLRPLGVGGHRREGPRGPHHHLHLPRRRRDGGLHPQALREVRRDRAERDALRGVPDRATPRSSSSPTASCRASCGPRSSSCARRASRSAWCGRSRCGRSRRRSCAGWPSQAKFFLACEMSMGQMVEDVHARRWTAAARSTSTAAPAATCRRRREVVAEVRKRM